jgi:hypothetical protein
MIDREFAAYVEGLPPQDRITVQQALDGLRDVLACNPRPEPETADALLLVDVVAGSLRAAR